MNTKNGHDWGCISHLEPDDCTCEPSERARIVAFLRERATASGWIRGKSASAAWINALNEAADAIEQMPSADPDAWEQVGFLKEKLRQAEQERDEWKERAMSFRNRERQAAVVRAGMIARHADMLNVLVETDACLKLLGWDETNWLRKDILAALAKAKGEVA